MMEAPPVCTTVVWFDQVTLSSVFPPCTLSTSGLAGMVRGFADRLPENAPAMLLEFTARTLNE